MPRIVDLIRKSQVAFSTFLRRTTPVACHPDPVHPPSAVQPEEILNEAVDPESDEVLALDALLDRQSFRANWVPPQPSVREKTRLWIEKCGLYDTTNSRWKGIAEGVSLGCLVSLFRRIIDAFQHEHCDNRDMVYSTQSYDPPPGDHIFKSLPSLAVCATPRSRSFSRPNGVCSLDSKATIYLGAIEVAIEDEIWESHENIQMGIYARNFLLEQPNRHSVTCLLLTEVNVRLYCFDSNGLVYFGALNIHERPLDFLSAISRISLMSQSREFDNPIYRYKECVSLHDGNVDSSPIEIPGWVPVYASKDLMGRRTVCWTVRDRTGYCYFLKNSSAFVDQANGILLEIQFLWLARGIPGICHVLDHREEPISCPLYSQKLRPVFLQRPEIPVLYNMRCTLAMEYYERSILDFNDRLDLLYILQDAVLAHEKLWMRGIWHDDIRPDNIRLANPGLHHDSRAVLIGFARAKKVDPMNGLNFNWVDDRRDNYTFKSRLRPLRYIPHYGYLHDLESFLLVLCYICAAIRKPHTHARPDRTVLRNMEGWSDNTDVASDLKDAFLTQVNRPGRVKPYFGHVFVDLICAWKVWSDAAFMEAPLRGHWKLSQTRVHYGDVLDMIDKAIGRVQQEEEEGEEGGEESP